MTTEALRAALEALVALHLDESPRQPGDDADAWADAWDAARTALAQPAEPALTDEEMADCGLLSEFGQREEAERAAWHEEMRRDAFGL